MACQGNDETGRCRKCRVRVARGGSPVPSESGRERQGITSSQSDVARADARARHSDRGVEWRDQVVSEPVASELDWWTSLVERVSLGPTWPISMTISVRSDRYQSRPAVRVTMNVKSVEDGAPITVSIQRIVPSFVTKDMGVEFVADI